MPKTLPVALAAAALCLAAPAPDDDALLHREYGFDGLRISKFNDGLAQLRSGDVDGDGLRDLAVVNNPKSRIEVLLQSTTPVEPDLVGDGVNELADEETFRRESFATEEKVASLALADLDGDGRDDLVFTGDSAELTVVPRPGGRFGSPRAVPLGAAATDATAVQTGDVDGDGLVDVVVFGNATTSVLRNVGDGRLDDPRVLPSPVERADRHDLVDVDGDGALDLVHVVLDSETPFHVRRGLGGGAFGAATTIRLAPLRSSAFADVDGDGLPEILGVRRRSGRVAMLAQRTVEADDELPLTPLRRVPLASLADAAPRSYAVGDVDGNGTVDVLVAEPSAARVMLHRATTGGTFGAAESLPSYVGVTSPRLAERDGDVELVVASPDEKAVGRATVTSAGVFGFPEPTAIPLDSELLAIDVAGGEVWTVLESGSRRRKTHRLRRADAPDTDEGFLFEPENDPSALRMADVDGDGRADAIVFVPNQVPTILVATDDGFVDARAASLPGFGILSGVAPAALHHGDVDGDGTAELLVPGPNFVRALGLDADGRPRVVAQVNLADASARVGAVAAGDLDGDGDVELVLVERSSDSLQVVDLDGERLAFVDLAGFAPRRLEVRDVDADGRADVLLFGDDAFATAFGGDAHLAYETVADYELPKTAMRSAFLDRIAVGDVNSDATADLVATETSKHSLVIFRVEPDALRYAVKFQVFEAKLFESQRGGREPRELLLDDLTGDGLTDIAVLVHDRIIVYPQEPAP